MTKVTIAKSYIEISGHSPQRVVCHGISAVSQMTANYLERRGLSKVKVGDGYFRIEFEDAHPVLDAFREALQDIDVEYPGNIKFEYVQLRDV